MTNILPIAAQKKLWGEHRARFIAVLSLMLIVLAVVAALSLVPAYVALELNTVSPGDATKGTTAAEGLRAIAKSHAQLKAIAPVVGATTSPTIAIAKVLALKPKGVAVERLQFSTTNRQLTIGGTATRETISAFRTALEADPSIKTVSLPVGALLSDDSRFTMTITGDF